jgi:hypothetical protein
MLFLPNAARQICALLGIKRRITMRAVLGIVADPFFARRASPPSARRCRAAMIAETGRLSDLIMANAALIKENTHFNPP